MLLVENLELGVGFILPLFAVAILFSAVFLARLIVFATVLGILTLVGVIDFLDFLSLTFQMFVE